MPEPAATRGFTAIAYCLAASLCFAASSMLKNLVSWTGEDTSWFAALMLTRFGLTVAGLALLITAVVKGFGKKS